MRLKTLLRSLAAFAALPLLGACSSDAPDSPGSETEWNGDKYIAVRISNVGGTRTTETDEGLQAGEGYEDGTTNENSISAEDVRFFFFDDNGNPFMFAPTAVINTNDDVVSNMVQPISLKSISQDGEQEYSKEGVLILGKPANGFIGSTPSQVVCIANPGDLFKDWKDSKGNNLAGMSLTELQACVSYDKEDSNFTAYTMTNSTYKNENNKIVFATECTNKFHNSADEATNDPVNIYIERLMAKVRVKGLGVKEVLAKDENGETQATSFSIYKADGSKDTDVKIYVSLDGWRLMKQHKNVKLIKDLNNVADDIFTDWNLPGYHRIFWEVTPWDDSTKPIWGTELDITSTTGFITNNSTGSGSNEVYTLPSTVFTHEPNTSNDRIADCTAIVVKAHLSSDVEGISQLSIVQWAGTYYYEEEFKKMVAAQYNKGKTDTEKIDESKVVFKPSTSPKAKSNSKDPYIIIGEDENGFDQFQPFNSTYNNIMVWEGGATSYYLNIEHKINNNTRYGIVRNHIYDTTIDNVVGLGIPGNDLVNEDPDKETFLAARINVLNWRVVSNTVTLQ